MPVRNNEILTSLTALVVATTLDESIRRIEMHADRLFGVAGSTVRLGDGPVEGANNGLVLRARGRVIGELSLASRDGGEPMLDADGEELAAFAAHAAVALDNARLLEDHQRRAQSDALTGLRNRGQFHETLARTMAGFADDPTRSLGLAIFDLDRFKHVNDRGGHAAGDRLLRATAAALTAACRASDLAFRLGGDEFALLLPGASSGEASVIAGRAAAAIAMLEGSEGVSWGVASVPGEARTREALVSIADGNMYAHKGRSQTAASIHGRGAARRLEVASRLAGKLTEPRDPGAVATCVVQELHSALGYYLAVVHRRHDDGTLRIVAGAGPLADADQAFLAWVQPISSGVNGRVARTGKYALVNDTRLDADYLGKDDIVDPGSELSVPILVDGEVWGVLNLEQLATHAFDENDVLLAETVVAQAGAALHRCVLLEEMERSFASTLALLCDALETKDPSTADHAERVAHVAERTAARLGLPQARRRALRYCALLHDVGKLGVNSELLTKESALTAAEYEEVKAHSDIGSVLLARIPLLADIAPLVRSVHERWDGSGYPDGLAGTHIPIEARIVAVCDAWQAMTSDRPYGRAISQDHALAELRSSVGTQFDPQVVEAFAAQRAASERA